MTDSPVLIEWLDSYGCGADWEDLKDVAAAPLECKSVGFIVYQDESCIVLVPHVTGEIAGMVNRQGCGDMTIPRCAVKAVKKLKVEEG